VATSGIHRVGVIGTGTISASWAAFFLSRGLVVAASDRAPQTEEFCAGLFCLLAGAG
jgi:carnitine 3-dehydrogenase